MPIAMVCMEESRPGDGRLCFCRRDKCNAATKLSSSTSWTLLAFLLLVWGVGTSFSSDTSFYLYHVVMVVVLFLRHSLSSIIYPPTSWKLLREPLLKVQELKPLVQELWSSLKSLNHRDQHYTTKLQRRNRRNFFNTTCQQIPTKVQSNEQNKLLELVPK